MENSSFQSQLLSVMEVLAQAAVAEINRRVDDSCAVLRVELSQSRRDIELLKSKYEEMEAELRRSRRRARRTGVGSVSADDENVSSSCKVGKSQSSDWDTEMGADSPNQSKQHAEMGSANEPETIQIKEECADDVWRNDPEDEQMSAGLEQPCFSNTQLAQTEGFLESYRSAENPESLVPPADGFNSFPEQQLREAELVVKDERGEESAENSARLPSGHAFVTEEAEAPLWSTSLYRDHPGVSYSGQRAEHIPSVFGSQTSLPLDQMVTKIHPVVKSHAVLLSAAKAKRRAKTFACRKQTDEGHGVLSRIHAMTCGLVAPQPQPPCRDAEEEAASSTNPAAALCWQSRGGSGPARRTRTSWRSGLGEKRFGCSYCDKTFLRFSQLKEHLRSHTGEKPYSCVQCGRSFTKQCNLIRHAVVHSGEKPFECSLCGKCFTQRSSLKSHQKTAH